MTTATTNPPKVWTTEDLLAMPDDGVERWIIRGQLREKPPEFPGVKMTVRNRHHSAIMALVTTVIVNWVRTRPKPSGGVYCGEVGLVLPERDSTVGVDVLYAPPSVVATQNDDNTTLIEGVPALVVEILSPNDTHEAVEEKTDEYLDAGVPLVWTVNTHRRTVTVHRPGQEPKLFSYSERLPEYPEMPGFTPAVAELFE